MCINNVFKGSEKRLKMEKNRTRTEKEGKRKTTKNNTTSPVAPLAHNMTQL